MRIAVPLKVTAWTLTVAALVFAAGTLGGYLYKSAYGRTRSSGLVRLLDVDHETSIPTWFSSALLLLSSGLLAVIGSTTRSSGRGGAIQWYGLAVVFLGLSIDEAAVIHEMFHQLIATRVGVDNPLKTFWIIPYTAFALVVLVVYWRFLLGLPGRTRWLFLVAGALYVAGTVGGEAVSVQYWRPQETQGFAFVAISTLEELLEMLGIILFIYALLDYLQHHVGEVQFRVDR